jgi:hypothetical protein
MPPTNNEITAIDATNKVMVAKDASIDLRMVSVL